jgi:hypothetical protein
MKCDFRASLLAHTFASLCFGHKPKARVATISLDPYFPILWHCNTHIKASKVLNFKQDGKWLFMVFCLEKFVPQITLLGEPTIHKAFRAISLCVWKVLYMHE